MVRRRDKENSPFGVSAAFALLIKQLEISSWLHASRLKGVRVEDDNDFHTLEYLSRCINQFFKDEMLKAHDDEIEIRVLSRAVISTSERVRELWRTKNKPSFGRFHTALFSYIRSSGTSTVELRPNWKKTVKDFYNYLDRRKKEGTYLVKAGFNTDLCFFNMSNVSAQGSRSKDALTIEMSKDINYITSNYVY